MATPTRGRNGFGNRAVWEDHPMPIRAIAFDLDDTLLDWSAAIATALDGLVDPDVAARFHAAIERDAWHRRDGIVVSRRHWRTVADSAHFFRAALGSDASPVRIDELASAYRERLTFPLFDDVLPALEALDGRVRLALLSNAPRALERAERSGILGRFDLALSAPADQKKPHPGAFELLLAGLGLRPEAVVYVGDDIEEDVEGALANGLHSVWIDRVGSAWEAPAPATRVTTLTALVDVITIAATDAT